MVQSAVRLVAPDRAAAGAEVVSQRAAPQWTDRYARAMPDLEGQRKSWLLPGALLLAACCGLVAFAFYWADRQSPCYDDSDPAYYFGGIVTLLAAPGILVGGVGTFLRILGRGRSDAWNVICGGLVLLYGALAVLLAIAVWWTWGGRVYCGGAPYGN